MSANGPEDLIQKATRRLESLARAGVRVPWAVAREMPGTGADPVPLVVPATDSAEDHLQAAYQAPAPEPAPAQSLHRVKLDFEFLRRGGVLVPSQARSDLAQQFRRVKSPLLRNARTATAAGSPPGQLIMVTSALSGEGKTFFSINLAMSMAMEVDTSVLLVDADVVRPGLFARLGIETGAPGLLDLLTQPALRLAQAVIATNLPKLALLAAGAPHERSTELLGSVAMERLLSQLVHDYPDHIIIFDAPPLLTTTEAAILAPMVGQIVVVVEAQRTPRRSVEQAFAALGGCPVVLSVLNKSETKDDSRSYGLATE